MQARRQQQSLPPSPKVRQAVSPLLGADALPGANPDRVALKESPLQYDICWKCLFSESFNRAKPSTLLLFLF